MKMSNLFGNTLREAPAGCCQLLLRAGYICWLSTGAFSYLHLAKRSLDKIERILRQEMDALGGQEIAMPVVYPVDMKDTKSGRQTGSAMSQLADQNGSDRALGMTDEAVVADMVQKEIRSYRQLPRLIYQIQTKSWDDLRLRAGLTRLRESVVMNSFSLDADWDGLEHQYEVHAQAYLKVVHRCGLSMIKAEADAAVMGGSLAHSLICLSSMGEDQVVICDSCGYTANRQIAKFTKDQNRSEPLLPVEKVATPDISTIEALSVFLSVPKSRIAKAYLAVAVLPEEEALKEKLVLAVIRGDLSVNENKLMNALGAQELRLATENEIRQAGTVPGFASPAGLKDVLIVADDSIQHSVNSVAGANENGFHLLNVNYGRDFTADVVTDIAMAEDGCGCPHCRKALRTVRGVEVGTLLKPGARFCDDIGCQYTDRGGSLKPVRMGSYTLRLERLLVCAAEAHHDDMGLIWPISIAPFQVHLIGLKGCEEAAAALYAQLEKNCIEVLFDDRQESPGAKFHDADLIGIPIRLTLGEKTLKDGCVDLKLRKESEHSMIPLGQAVEEIRKRIDLLQAEAGGNMPSANFK